MIDSGWLNMKARLQFLDVNQRSFDSRWICLIILYTKFFTTDEAWSSIINFFFIFWGRYVTNILNISFQIVLLFDIIRTVLVLLADSIYGIWSVTDFIWWYNSWAVLRKFSPRELLLEYTRIRTYTPRIFLCKIWTFWPGVIWGEIIQLPW